MNDTQCGIDFGTSNSAVAIGSSGKVSLVELEDKNVTLPTAVFFNVEEGRTVFGREAVSEYLDGYTGRLMRSLKSILGSDLILDATQIGHKKINFSDIIGLFIGHIKTVSEQKIGKPCENVVLGRPVFFVDNDEAADKRAENELKAIALAQGFKNVSFEFEPIAAARDYESVIEREELVLVVDIGGGTSDFSLIRLSPESRHKDDRTSDILANAGVHIGGTDFDKKFSLATVMPQLGYQTTLRNGLSMPLSPYHTLATWHLINSLYTPKSKTFLKGIYAESQEKHLVSRLLHVVDHHKGHELANKIESAKITLSGADSTSLDLSFIEKEWSMNLVQNDLKNAAEKDVERIIDVAVKMVEHIATIKSGDIHTIFMTGGSTGLPGFTEGIQGAFPAAKIFMGDKFSSVAKGLGISAMRRYR